ncbi:sigma-54-dependent transcriptional regulator [Tropicimonas sp.]|uniref:sigma-54-dependent transcriptional regulator n=1 Tax=Tropicimonas sp. TaxID=2067044 RepID=UPI003A89723E
MNTPIARTVLVVEDDRTLNHLICDQLEDLGYRPTGVRSRGEALELLTSFAPDAALLDVRLPDCDGLSFLPELREYCPVIVLTAFGSIDQAVNAVKNGASEYLVKPISGDGLEIALSKVFETAALRRDLEFWRAEAQRSKRVELIGECPGIVELRNMARLLAASDSPVLILGEGGTGKGVTASAIHAQSPRANGRFVAVECDPEMLESELFGKVRDGRLIEGLFAAADNGTIFLNDVDKLSGSLQGRLLGLLEQGSYRPHGSIAEIQASARIIAASAADLETAAQQGHFRPQLYYRLSGFTLHLPPLRERAGDLEMLAEFLLENRSFQRGVEKHFAPDALAALHAYDWPGNVRELANAVDRSVMMSVGQTEISAQHLGLGPRPVSEVHGSAVALRFADPPTLDQMRDSYIALLIDRFDGNRQRIAAALGISERNLYRIIKAQGLSG